MSPIKQYVIVLDDRSEVRTERKKERKKEQNNEQKKEKLKGEMNENNSIYILQFGKDTMLDYSLMNLLKSQFKKKHCIS